ncbi:hypothetical protein K458DRAFT_321114, partial [Lentithecium fluviatile CBS 122367]
MAWTPPTTPTLSGMPNEIMCMIMLAKIKDASQSVSHEEEYIISSTEFFNLRLMSRQMAAATYLAFVDRYFKTRKHMLSKHSLFVLLRIAGCISLRGYVREVAFGPELINPHPNPRWYIDRKVWKEQELAHLKLVREQNDFDNIDGLAKRIIEAALKRLPNLERVRLDCFPQEGNELNEREWTTSYGSASILRQIGW